MEGLESFFSFFLGLSSSVSVHACRFGVFVPAFGSRFCFGSRFGFTFLGAVWISMGSASLGRSSSSELAIYTHTHTCTHAHGASSEAADEDTSWDFCSTAEAKKTWNEAKLRAHISRSPRSARDCNRDRSIAEALPAIASYHFRTRRHDTQGHDIA